MEEYTDYQYNSAADVMKKTAPILPISFMVSVLVHPQTHTQIRRTPAPLVLYRVARQWMDMGHHPTAQPLPIRGSAICDHCQI